MIELGMITDSSQMPKFAQELWAPFSLDYAQTTNLIFYITVY